MTKKKTQKKKEEPKQQEPHYLDTYVERTLSFHLTEHEQRNLGLDVAELMRKKMLIENEFERIKKDFKGRIEAVDREMHEKAEMQIEGTEERLVVCMKRMDYDRQVVMYMYGDPPEIFEERPFQGEEKQMRIPDKSETKPPEPKTPDEETDADKDHIDVADVIAEETNRKTKHSAVDGEKKS